MVELTSIPRMPCDVTWERFIQQRKRNGREDSIEVRNIKFGQIECLFFFYFDLSTGYRFIAFSFRLNRIAPVLENKEHEGVLDHEVDDLSASDDEVRKICRNFY